MMVKNVTFVIELLKECCMCEDVSGLSSTIQEICTLENQIHRVEMNLMEAEHIKKKYRIIQGNLLEDSVAFESTLMKIEEAIKKQESEMMHLKVRTKYTGEV